MAILGLAPATSKSIGEKLEGNFAVQFGVYAAVNDSHAHRPDLFPQYDKSGCSFLFDEEREHTVRRQN